MFIVACNNTSTSELVYEWISGFERDVAEGDEVGVCREAVFSTLVMVKEYSLTWDERLKECVLVSTGRSWPTVVAACDGNSC